MRLLLVIIHIVLVGTHVWASAHFREEIEDNEFAEFEDFEEDDEKISVDDTVQQSQPAASDGNTSPTPDSLEEEDDGLVEVVHTHVWLL